MDRQLRIPGTERPPPTEDQRLDCRLSNGDTIKRARREGRCTVEYTCKACGENNVVFP